MRSTCESARLAERQPASRMTAYGGHSVASPTKHVPATVCTLLREKLDPAELQRLLAEGARLSGDEACRLALED